MASKVFRVFSKGFGDTFFLSSFSSAASSYKRLVMIFTYLIFRACKDWLAKHGCQPCAALKRRVCFRCWMFTAAWTTPVQFLSNLQRVGEHSHGPLVWAPEPTHVEIDGLARRARAPTLIPRACTKPSTIKVPFARNLTLTHSRRESQFADSVNTASGSFSASALMTKSCSVFLIIFTNSTCTSSVYSLTTWKHHDVINISHVVAFVSLFKSFCCNSCTGALHLCVFPRDSSGPGCSVCVLPDRSFLSVLTSPSCWSICTSSGFPSAFLLYRVGPNLL